MKLIFTLSLALFATITVNAQTEKQDVVYLKNGSIIKGQIQANPDPTGDGRPETVRIALMGGSVFVFNQSDIDSIKQENPFKARLAKIKTDYFRRNRGYRGITEFGLIYGTNLKANSSTDVYYGYNSQPDDFGMSLHSINGYQWWPYLFTGAGVGIDRYITYHQTFSPFYLRVSSEFLKRKVTPYVFCDAGYAVMWNQKETGITYNNKGGLYIAAGGGVRIYTRARASVTLSAVYKRTSSESKWHYTDYDYYSYDIKKTYQRLAINIGVNF